MERNEDKRKKIVFIHHATGIGGALLSLLYLLQKLDETKMQAKILCLEDSDAVALLRKTNLEVRVLNSWRYFSHSEVYWIRWNRPDLLVLATIAWFVTAFSYGKRILSVEKPDLVYLNSTPLSAWAVAAKALDIPVICHVREPIKDGYIGVRKSFLRYILKRNTEQFISISKQNARALNIPQKTTVIHDFVHFDEFNRSITPAIVPNKISKEEKVILYPGGAATIKGFEVVVEALEYLNPNILVVFAGFIRSRERWKMLARQILKPKLARFIQKLDSSPNAVQIGIQTDMPKWIAACDVLIAPFTVPHFARPVIEAGAMAKPVVASSVDGMEELVENGITGILVPPGDAKGLAQAINRLCDDEFLAVRMGEAGYERAKALFDGEKNARETFKIFQEVLTSRNCQIKEWSCEKYA